MDYSKWDRIDDTHDDDDARGPVRAAVSQAPGSFLSLPGLSANARLTRLVRSSRRAAADERVRSLIDIAQTYRADVAAVAERDTATLEAEIALLDGATATLRNVAAAGFGDAPLPADHSSIDAELLRVSTELAAAGARLSARCPPNPPKSTASEAHDSHDHDHDHSHGACSHKHAPAVVGPAPPAPWPASLRERCTALQSDASLLTALLQLRRRAIADSADTLRAAILAAPRSSPAWLLRGRAFLALGAGSSAGGLLLGLLHAHKCLSLAGRHPDHVSDSLAIADERAGLSRVIRPLAEEYPGYDGEGEGAGARTPLPPSPAPSPLLLLPCAAGGGSVGAGAVADDAEALLAGPAALRADAASARASLAAARLRRLEAASPLAAARGASVVRLGPKGERILPSPALTRGAPMSPEEAAWRERFSGARRRAAAAAVASDPLVAHLEGVVRDVLWALQAVDAAPEAALLASEAARLRALAGGGGGLAAALRAVSSEAAVLVHEGFFFSAAAKCAVVAEAAAGALLLQAEEGGLPAADLATTLSRCVDRVRAAFAAPVPPAGAAPEGSEPPAAPPTPASPAVADSTAQTTPASGDPPRSAFEPLLVAALLNAALCCLKREWGRASAVAACSGALIALTHGSDLQGTPGGGSAWPGWRDVLAQPRLGPPQLLQACKALYRRGMARLGGITEAAAAEADFATAAASLRSFLASQMGADGGFTPPTPLSPLSPLPAAAGAVSPAALSGSPHAAAAAAMLRECVRGLRSARYTRSQLEARREAQQRAAEGVLLRGSEQ